MSKDLIKYNNNIFSKIKNFLFGIKKHKKSEKCTKERMTTEEYEKEKQEIMELYKKIKDRQIEPQYVSEDKLEKINELIKAEIELKNRKIEQLITEKNMYEYNTKKIEEEIEKYKKLLEENVG